MDLIGNDFSEDLHLAFQDVKKYIEKSSNVYVQQAIYYYAASLTEPKFAEIFKKESERDEFWSDGFPDAYDRADEIYYLVRMNLSGKNHVDNIVNDGLLDNQKMSGELINEHALGLRALIAHDRYSLNTSKAIDFFLEYINDVNELSDLSKYEFMDIPKDILVLMELDFYKYKDKINDLIEILISRQKEDGNFFDDISSCGFQISPVKEVCLSIIAMSRFFDQNDFHITSACNFLRTSRPNTDTGWNYRSPYVCIALVEAGFGPKVSKSFHDWEIEKFNQLKLKTTPDFIHTSPIFDKKIHIKQIHDRIIEMLKRAKKDILISSLYVDMLYEDLINIASKDISIKIIVRPALRRKGIKAAYQ